MFDFAKWVVDNLISGVKNGAFPREWAAVQLGNYYVRGKVTDDDIVRFDEETITPEETIASEVTAEVDNG